MKKQTRRKQSEAKVKMRAVYDFSIGVRGKHAAKYAEGTSVVVLEPDVRTRISNHRAGERNIAAVSKLLQPQRKRTGRKTA